MRNNLKSLFENELYSITAEDHSNGKSNIDVVKELIDTGVKIIQYREKSKKALYKYEECLEIRKLTKDADVTFIVNDDIDIAILVSADGVHVGQEDVPIEKVRELVGDSMIIGLSTHSPLQAQDAVKRGADYIGVGPIFKTQTKVDVVDPVGFEYLDYVVESIDIPFVAIGGIKEHNLKQVVDHGASCVCLVSEIVGARDISEKVKNIKDIISNRKS